MSPRAVSTEKPSKLPAGLARFLTTLVLGLRVNANERAKRSEKASKVEEAVAELAAAYVLTSLADAIDGARRAVE